MIKNQSNKNRNRVIQINTKSNSYVREHLGTDSDGSPRTPRKIITESVYDENRHMSINNDYSPKRIPIEKIIEKIVEATAKPHQSKRHAQILVLVTPLR